MENLSGALVGGGPQGLEEELQAGLDPGMPWIGQPGGDPGWAGYQPDPDSPLGPGDPWGGWGGRPGDWQPPPPPDPGSCQGLREACEAMLIEQANVGLPPVPMPPRPSAWSDTIDSIEMLGHCAGDRIIIHGHDFGNIQSPNVELVMNVGGSCAVVQPVSWSDTRIEVLLPPGARSGPVGFYNPAQQEAEIGRYNSEAGTFNSAARGMMAASKCIGAPLDLDLFPAILQMRVPCAPVGDHNWIEAGLPVIGSFYAATDTAEGDFIPVDPDDVLILRWNVETAETIVITRVSATGPPVPDSIDVNSSALVLGPAGHSAPTTFIYRLSAANICGTVSAEVSILASKRPRLEIEAIEVTQSIQTMDHDVKLIRHKPTVVRVYASHGLDGFTTENTVPGLKGRLRIVANGVPPSPWFDPVNGADTQSPDPPLPVLGASINLPAEVDRKITNHTLNFVVPEGRCEGTLGFEVEVRVDDFGVPEGRQGFDERVNRTFEDFTFHARKPLKLRFIPARVILNADNTSITQIAGFSNPPTDAQCRDFLTEALKFLPSTAADIMRLEGHEVVIEGGRVVIRTPAIEVPINVGPMEFPIDLGFLPINTESVTYDVHANAILEWYGVLKGCDFVDLLGLACPANDDEFWVILAPVTGVWGRAHWAAAVCITPMDLTSAAHEIAHTLDQEHLIADCSGGGTPVSSDPISDPDNWEDGGEIVPEKIVPFDVIRNTTVINDNSGVWDLMSYCPTRWTHAERWEMLFDKIGG
jgi:hypothetical protein